MECVSYQESSKKRNKPVKRNNIFKCNNILERSSFEKWRSPNSELQECPNIKVSSSHSRTSSSVHESWPRHLNSHAIPYSPYSASSGSGSKQCERNYRRDYKEGKREYRKDERAYRKDRRGHRRDIDRGRYCETGRERRKERDEEKRRYQKKRIRKERRERESVPTRESESVEPLSDRIHRWVRSEDVFLISRLREYEESVKGRESIQYENTRYEDMLLDGPTEVHEAKVPGHILPLEQHELGQHEFGRSVHLEICRNVVEVNVRPQDIRRISLEVEISKTKDPLCAEDRLVTNEEKEKKEEKGEGMEKDVEGERLRQAGCMIIQSVLSNSVKSEELPDPSILEHTPDRFSKMILEMTSGYRLDPNDIVRGAIFRSGGSTSTEVAVHDVPVASLCEHHLLPFHGICNIAYIPRNYVLGLSKFSRVVDAFAYRFQLQERLTEQIAEFLDTSLHPKALAVTITAVHGCMLLRGVRAVTSKTTTRTFLIDEGCFESAEKVEAVRQQLFSLLKG